MEPPPLAGTQTEPDSAVFQSCEAEMTKCPRQPYARWHLELPQRYFLAGAAQGLMRLLLLTRFLLYTEMIRDDCEQTFAAALRHINKLLQLLTDLRDGKDTRPLLRHPLLILAVPLPAPSTAVPPAIRLMETPPHAPAGSAQPSAPSDTTEPPQLPSERCCRALPAEPGLEHRSNSPTQHRASATTLPCSSPWSY